MNRKKQKEKPKWKAEVGSYIVSTIDYKHQGEVLAHILAGSKVPCYKIRNQITGKIDVICGDVKILYSKEMLKNIKKLEAEKPKKKVKTKQKGRASLKRRAKNIQRKRSKRAKTMDAKKTSKRTLPLTLKNIKIWRKNPGRLDLLGIDTKGLGK